VTGEARFDTRSAPARIPRARGGVDQGPEHALLSRRRRDTTVALSLTALTVLFFVAIALQIPSIQHLDDRWLNLMLDAQSSPLEPVTTGIAKVFNVLGGIYVTLPVRLAVAGYLAWRRRWWHFAAFVSAMVTSEILIGTVKHLYGRPRPDVVALVPTSGDSFPSGHAVAASVTAVAIVIALFPDGPRRIWWGVGAAIFAFVMALSRAYLGAHWLTDTAAGTMLGVTVALDSALVVQELWDRRIQRRATRGDGSVPPATPEAAGTPVPDG